MNFKYITLTLTTFLVIIGLSIFLVRHVTAEQIPELAWKCLPPPLHGQNLDIKNSELLEGITTDKEATYLIVRMVYRDASIFANEKEMEYVGRFAIKLADGFCVNLNDPRMAADFVFSSRIPTLPEPVAKEIALQFWRRQLELDGNNLEKFKAELMKGFEPGPEVTAIYPEDQWALKQLGIDIPLNEPGVGPVTNEGMWQLLHGDDKDKPTPSPSGKLFEQERRQLQQLEKQF